MAAQQLGTVGSGNHYVDLFAGDDGFVWVGVHFGSRGFGHKTASGFLALAEGKASRSTRPRVRWTARRSCSRVDSRARAVLHRRDALAGEYAYAGRDVVVDKVLEILGAQATYEVHNHHNFAWRETPRRRRRLGDPQGLHAGVPRAGRVRRRDDGRAVA